MEEYKSVSKATGVGLEVQKVRFCHRWFLNGKPHREDGPAVDHLNGTYEWYRNGVKHREDGPAIKHFDGSSHWYYCGMRHRIDGPAIDPGVRSKLPTCYYLFDKELPRDVYRDMVLPDHSKLPLYINTEYSEVVEAILKGRDPRI